MDHSQDGSRGRRRRKGEVKPQVVEEGPSIHVVGVVHSLNKGEIWGKFSPTAEIVKDLSKPQCPLNGQRVEILFPSACFFLVSQFRGLMPETIVNNLELSP